MPDTPEIQASEDRSPDLEGLALFADTYDRDLTPFFAGRETEIEAVGKLVEIVVNRVRERSGKPAAGQTTLISGAPGAGKTSLMDKLAEMWAPPDDGNGAPRAGDAPYGINVDLASLKSADDLFRSILHKLPEKERKALGVVGRRSLGVSIQVAGTGGGVELGAAAPESAESGIARLRRPLVLFIDEVQTLPRNEQAPECRLLQSLHKGLHGAPIIPVLAGLGNARAVLDDAGLSRTGYGAEMALGTLDPGRAAESARMFFFRYRVLGDRDAWAARVERWSDLWPMHIHNALRALAGALARNGGDLGRIDDGSVRGAAFAARGAYYADRASGIFERCPTMTARMLAGVESATHPEWLRLVGQEMRSIPEDEAEEIEGMGRSEIFDRMVARGLLQGAFDALRRYSCPIPSLRSWCVAAGGGELQKAAILGDTKETTALIGNGADVGARDPWGRTPLHLAAEHGWPDVARVLLDAGADSHTKDGRGRTPLDMARGGAMRAVLDGEDV